MKCDKCGKAIKDGETYYTALGIKQCEECNVQSHGTINLNFVLKKIEEEDNKNG